MTVLVTGVAGFIGFHVAAALLDRGETVIGIDNLNDYYQVSLKRDRLTTLEAHDGDFTFHQVDFGDHEALDRALEGESFSRIVHLGAQAGVRYSLENPRAYVHSNLAGHVNILELARHRHTQHLVYASSSSVYGNNESLPFRVEDRVDHPISLYAATKKADELMSETYAHLYRIPQTGLRFFTVYGPRQRPDLAIHQFFRKISAGTPIQQFGDGTTRRDYTFVADIIQGVRGAMDRKQGGPFEIYNLGNSDTIMLRELIAAIEQEIGKKAIIDLKPEQPGDVPQTFADVSKAGSHFGYTPTTSIREGLKLFHDWIAQGEKVAR